MLFKFCSLFSAGLDESDARAILPQSAHQAFIALVSKSLLDHDPISGRYSMLSPLRRYAESLLSHEDPAVKDRWIQYCVEKSRIYDEKIRGNNPTNSENLVFELPNLLMALDCIISDTNLNPEQGFLILFNISVFMRFRGLHEDAKHFLNEFRSRAGGIW